MRLIHCKDLTAAHLKHRVFLCHLPTELVLSDQSTQIVLDRAYYYYLPINEFPPKPYMTEHCRGHHRQIAVEWHTDCGDDGHTNYRFADYYIVGYEDEIDIYQKWNAQKYADISGIAYDLRDEMIKGCPQQLTFNNIHPRRFDYYWY
jgi:hypothetical protein